MSRTIQSVATLAATLALLATAFMLMPPAPASGQEDACPVPDHPVDPDDPMITVDLPEADGGITSPVAIEGQAGLFEANVRIQILDADANVLADTFTTAEAAGPELHPFATSVEFESPAEAQPGCVWVFEESAEDGSFVNVVSIPVNLEVDGEPDPSDPAPGDEDPAPDPAETGNAGLIGGGGSMLPALVLGALTLAALPAIRAGLNARR